jgi:hypothetical protein
MKEFAVLVWLTLASTGADISGKWTGTFSVAGSDHKEPQLFIFKQEGKQLTGSGGPDAVEQYPISNGSVEGDHVTFELATDNWTFKYDLKRAGPELNGDLLLKNKKGDSRTAHVSLKRTVVASEVGAIQPNAQDAVPAILHAFDQFPVVAIGEIHSIKEVGEFYLSLIKDPRFQAKVNCIVIEFGARLSQPVIDRYVNGEEVALSELQHVWRDTTKVFAFESPVYAQLLTAVREVNLGLPPDRRIRVLAGDSPIDWTKVTTHEQWASYQPNDLSFAEVIGEEVLARNRKALVILGGTHVSKNRDLNRGPNTTTLVERKHPGSVYVVLLTQSTRAAESKGKVAWLQPTPEAADVGDFGDALLYLGKNLTPVDPDWRQYRTDLVYVKELDRRARIEWGCGFDLNRFINGQLPCP